MAAEFIFPRATFSLSHDVFIHSFLSLASLASQPALFYAYDAEQSLVMDMWCGGKDAFKTWHRTVCQWYREAAVATLVS